MEYISVAEYATKHRISERTARNYCATGKIEGAYLFGKTWNLPIDAVLPKKKSTKAIMSLLTALREQKSIYHGDNQPFPLHRLHH